MDEHAQQCLDFYRVRELLAAQALTALGRRLAEQVQPVTRRELVQRWYAQIGELEQLVEQRGWPPFGGISDVRPVIENCAPPLRVSAEDLARVGQTLAGTHAVARYLADLPAELAELGHLATRIGDFSTVAQRIHAVIDERGHVRDAASPKLARVRQEIAASASAIGETVEKLLHDPTIRRYLQYPNHTFHNDRLVLPLRAECRGRLPGIIHRMSDSGATLYVEPAQAVELNNQISNLRVTEFEEVNRLLWELAHEVYLNAAEIVRTLDAVAVLDLVTAKVRLARRLELCCPELTDDSVVSMRAARHPLLLEMHRGRREAGEQVGEVVPVDYRLGEDFDLLIVTGPNTGGKTVLLKTVGLLGLMVQAGLPVPVAPGSRTGLFANVLIDIGDEQSMDQSLSTFSAHMQRLLDMLRRAGPRTLVLIDELGAGTDPDEGAAIGRAVLDELLRLQCRCIVTTHFGALKSFALMRERAENGSVEFDAETLRPTYHLRIGEAGASNAIEIAQRLGMPKRLVQAARRNLSHKAKALKSALAGAATIKREAEVARQAATSARDDAARARDAAETSRQQFEQNKADFQEWVARVVHLRPGDAVRVRHFDRDGKLVRLRLDLHRAEVDVGALTVEVPLGDLLPPQAPEPPPAPPRPPTALVAAQAPRPGQVGPPRGPKHGGPRPSPTPEVAGSPRGSEGPGHARQHDARPAPPPPKLPRLTEKQLAALKAGDRVYARRFLREGTIIRMVPARQLALVSMGLLEVEIPFDGLAARSGGDAHKEG